MRRRYVLAATALCSAGIVAQVSRVAMHRDDAGFGGADSPARSEYGAVGSKIIYPQGMRSGAPRITGSLLGGGRLDSSTIAGFVVAVNFWGSWCGPCQSEASDLQATFTATQALGVRFLGINVNDHYDAAVAFEVANRITYPSLFDPAGKLALAFEGVPPNAVPSTVLIDRRGQIAAVFIGAIRRQVFEPLLMGLVREEIEPSLTTPPAPLRPDV